MCTEEHHQVRVLTVPGAQHVEHVEQGGLAARGVIGKFLGAIDHAGTHAACHARYVVVLGRYVHLVDRRGRQGVANRVFDERPAGNFDQVLGRHALEPPRAGIMATTAMASRDVHHSLR